MMLGRCAAILLVLGLVLPSTARSDDSPRADPLKEHEATLREVLDSWNDIATALSLIRDAPGAQKNGNVVRETLQSASRTGKKLGLLPRPTPAQDRELCRRVQARAKEVRARVQGQSERVARITELPSQMKEVLDSVALVVKTLDRLILKGEEATR
jgi:hypothetical protein